MSELTHASTSLEGSYLLAEKAVAGSACILSIFGALLVIFSFAYDFETRFSFKELYYKICCGFSVQEKFRNREWVTKYMLKSYNYILINISIADILVAASHFWGLLSNLEHKFYHNSSTNGNSSISSGQDVSCTTQGAFTALSTISSFFWTDILAVFLAFNIVFKRCTNSRLSRVFVDFKTENGKVKIVVEGRETSCCDTPLFLYIIFPFIGWGIPMIMVMVNAVEDMLGYIEDYDGGWCYFFLDPNTMSEHRRKAIINYGYEMWLWGSVVLVLLCTIAYAIFACIRGRESQRFKTDCTHIRYLSVGIAFALLRVPSTIINLYLIHNKTNYETIAAALINIVASVTISLQGGVNGVIYLCCRTSVKRSCCYNRQPQDLDEHRPLNHA